MAGVAPAVLRSAIRDGDGDGGGDDFDFDVHGGIYAERWKHADLSPATVMRTANRQAHLTFAKSAKFVNDLRVVYEIQTRLQPETQPQSAPAVPQQNHVAGESAGPVADFAASGTQPVAYGSDAGFLM